MAQRKCFNISGVINVIATDEVSLGSLRAEQSLLRLDGEVFFFLQCISRFPTCWSPQRRGNGSYPARWKTANIFPAKSLPHPCTSLLVGISLDQVGHYPGHGGLRGCGCEQLFWRIRKRRSWGEVNCGLHDAGCCTDHSLSGTRGLEEGERMSIPEDRAQLESCRG